MSKSKGNAIILVHGSGENSDIWKNQFENLNLKYNLIAIDLPSHGKSDSILDLSLESYVKVIEGLIKTLEIKKVILCGHSLGGAITQEFFFKNSKQVLALILCGTGARLRVSPIVLNTLKNNYQEFLDSISIGFYRKTSKDIINDFLNQMSKTEAAVVYHDFKICDNFDIMDKVTSISVPSLIICGNKDLLTPIKYSQYFKDNIKDSKLVIIKDAGHMVMIEKPNEFNLAIQDFIENNLEQKYT